MAFKKIGISMLSRSDEAMPAAGPVDAGHGSGRSGNRRTTSALLALFSLVTLLATQLARGWGPPIRQAAPGITQDLADLQRCTGRRAQAVVAQHRFISVPGIFLLLRRSGLDAEHRPLEDEIHRQITPADSCRNDTAEKRLGARARPALGLDESSVMATWENTY